MKNINLTQLDANQVTSREHDESHDAKRVFLVGGEKLDISVDSEKIVQAIKDGMASIKFETLVPEKIDQVEPHFNVITVEKQVFIPQVEYKTLEVPVIVKEIQYKEVEKPIYITEYKTIEVVNKDNNEVPKLMKFVLIGQALMTLVILITHFLK